MARDKTDSTQEKLLNVAKRLFAEKGYEGTSVKDLADAAGVNISLISYHFEGKEGLYRACLQEYGEDKLKKAQFFLEAPTNLEEFRVRLTLFTNYLIESQAEDPHVTKLIHRYMDLPNSMTKDIFNKTFFKIFETLVGFFESGKKIGILRPDIDPIKFSQFYFGGINHFSRCDHISLERFSRTISDPSYRKQVVEEIINSLLNGITLRSSE